MWCDLKRSFNRLPALATIAGLRFILDHRRSRLGTWWTLVSPLSYIFALGYLFSKVNRVEFSFYVEYLAIGLITWTLVAGIVADSAKVFLTYRGYFIQGEMSATDVIVLQLLRNFIVFFYQSTIIALIVAFRYADLGVAALSSVLGYIIIAINGIFFCTILGIIGARFRDTSEMITAATRILFLATPVMWVTDEIVGRGHVLAAYVYLNPFYHFIEIVRRPLTNGEVPILSWVVVLAITAVGGVAATVIYKRFKGIVAIWV